MYRLFWFLMFSVQPIWLKIGTAEANIHLHIMFWNHWNCFIGCREMMEGRLEVAMHGACEFRKWKNFEQI